MWGSCSSVANRDELDTPYPLATLADTTPAPDSHVCSANSNDGGSTYAQVCCCGVPDDGTTCSIAPTILPDQRQIFEYRPIASSYTLSDSCGGAGSTTPLVNPYWFKWTPQTGGSYTLSTCGSLWDTVLAVFTTCPTGTTVSPDVCNDDNDCQGTGGQGPPAVARGNSRLTLVVNAPPSGIYPTYYIAVGSKSGTIPVGAPTQLQLLSPGRNVPLNLGEFTASNYHTFSTTKSRG